MSIDQILSVLEISQDGITLVTGQFLNTRLNILKISRYDAYGLENNRVVNFGALVDSVKKVISDSSEALGVNISKVILLIPGFDVEKKSRRITVSISNSERLVSAKEIRKLISDANRLENQTSRELINTSINNFYVNQVKQDGAPLNVSGDLLTGDIDLYYANKEVTHQFVKIVETAGVQVADICLDAFAAMKEMPLSDESFNKHIVTIDLHEHFTALALVSRGRLLTVTTIDIGYDCWLRDIINHGDIDIRSARKLIENNLSLKEKDNNIICWYDKVDGNTSTVSVAQLNSLANKGIYKWVKEIAQLCQMIAEKGEIKYYLYGRAVNIEGIEEVLKDEIKGDLKLYSPSTIGARDSSLVSILGAFYVHFDQKYLFSKQLDCIDRLAFRESIEKTLDDNDNIITSKIKKWFER
ncbi:MAG: hypothetical protein ACK5G7_00255 [Erysipelotrichaceae bacterium]